jgi:chemotaxis-related protein WspB
MLVLTFQVGREPLALDIRRVRLRPVSGAPDWLAGVFVYRGQAVPVIDLHRLVGGPECPSHLSSRIILVPHDGPGEGRLLGLLATQVADIREVHPGGALSSPAEGRVGLGPVVVDGPRVLRLLDPDRLLPGAAGSQFLDLPGERPRVGAGQEVELVLEAGDGRSAYPGGGVSHTFTPEDDQQPLPGAYGTGFAVAVKGESHAADAIRRG